SPAGAGGRWTMDDGRWAVILVSHRPSSVVRLMVNSPRPDRNRGRITPRRVGDVLGAGGGGAQLCLERAAGGGGIGGHIGLAGHGAHTLVVRLLAAARPELHPPRDDHCLAARLP